jgi:hypothetical protein
MGVSLETTLGLAIITYFTFIYLVYFGDPRFHFSVMPWVMMTVAAWAARVSGAGIDPTNINPFLVSE